MRIEVAVRKLVLLLLSLALVQAEAGTYYVSTRGSDYALSDGGSDFSYNLGPALASDPRFANSTTSGFDSHLRTGSPAIQAAVNLYSLFTTDIAGTTRQTTGGMALR